MDNKASFDDQISNRRARIVELTKEIESLEKQKSELEWEKLFPTEEIIDQEATKCVESDEVAL